MKPGRRRWIWWLSGCAGVGLVLQSLVRFPWGDTVAALAGVNWTLLGAALLLNLLSPLAKGSAWHLLLCRVARNRWWVAQEANLVGTAVNSVAVGVSGDAARSAWVARHDGVPLRAAVLSIVGTRAVEALGLALFLVLAPFVLRLPAALRRLQLGGAVVLGTGVLLTRLPGWTGLVARLPLAVRAAAADLAEVSWGVRVLAPGMLALASWGVEWGVYHLALRATHVPLSAAASFTALVAVNLSGLIRLTPANVGVMQAAIVGALLPFGIAAERALAGGIALQAIEVLPILVLALAAVGRSGVRRLAAETDKVTDPKRVGITVSDYFV